MPLTDLLGKAIFVSLLGLIVLTAIPYGTVETWWRAFFVCVVFALCILWIIEGFLSESWSTGGGAVLLPLFVLAGFSLLQTITLGPMDTPIPGIPYSPWNAISADPYETRFFALQLLGLTIAGALFYRYAASAGRIGALVNVIIAVAVASAIYGLLRQTTQHSLGFGLPLLKPNEGYGQFVNKNHFAYLMEMGLGLSLGMIAGGGVKRERALIYFASLLPIWTALVLSNSRGGILGMLAQLVAGALLLTIVVPASKSNGSQLKIVSFARLFPVRVLLLLLLLLGVAWGTIWLGGEQLASRIEVTRGEFDLTTDESRQGASRNEIWRSTWQMFKANPIVGVGMNGYWAAIPAYHDASGMLTPQEAHNEYLELLSSGGIIGLAIGAWFALVLFRRIRENLRSPNRFRRTTCFAASLGIVGVAVHSLLDFGLHMIVNALVFMALVVIATCRWERESRLRRSYV